MSRNNSPIPAGPAPRRRGVSTRAFATPRRGVAWGHDRLLNRVPGPSAGDRDFFRCSCRLDSDRALGHLWPAPHAAPQRSARLYLTRRRARLASSSERAFADRAPFCIDLRTAMECEPTGLESAATAAGRGRARRHHGARARESKNHFAPPGLRKRRVTNLGHQGDTLDGAKVDVLRMRRTDRRGDADQGRSVAKKSGIKRRKIGVPQTAGDRLNGYQKGLILP